MIENERGAIETKMGGWGIDKKRPRHGEQLRLEKPPCWGAVFDSLDPLVLRSRPPINRRAMVAARGQVPWLTVRTT